MNTPLERVIKKLSEWATRLPPLLMTIDMNAVRLYSFVSVIKVSASEIEFSIDEGGKSCLVISLAGASFNEDCVPIPSGGAIPVFDRLVITLLNGGSCSVQEMPNREFMPQISTDIVQ